MKPDLSSLIPKEAALARLTEAWKPQLEAEQIPLEAANGRVLAEDQLARYDLPVVRASTMDGVAVRSEAFASGVPDASGWKLGQDYVRADTGDDFDDAFDAVIAIEQVELLPSGGLNFHGQFDVKPGSNVKPQGSDVKKGSLLVPKGTRLGAMTMSAIAMGGISEIMVLKKPKVAFIPTGSELVAAGTALQRGQNFDSNSILVRQLLLDMGAEPIMHPIVRDDPAALDAAINELLPQADVILVNAGTSKGGEDYCHSMLKARGTPLFEGIAAVPGRPMNAVMLNGIPVLNLSGPSFAAFYSVDYMVRGLICHALGQKPSQRETVSARLTSPLMKPPFFSLMSPMSVTKTAHGYETAPVAVRGKGAKGAAAAMNAEGIYITTPGEAASEAGSTITVELLKNRAELPEAETPSVKPIALPERCNQCPNSCPVEALKCGRGRAYFQRLIAGTEFTSSNELLTLLAQCGDSAKHMAKRTQQMGGDENTILTLEPEEQQTLSALLHKQKQQWDIAHAKFHNSHKHGHADGAK